MAEPHWFNLRVQSTSLHAVNQSADSRARAVDNQRESKNEERMSTK